MICVWHCCIVEKCLKINFVTSTIINVHVWNPLVTVSHSEYKTLELFTVSTGFSFMDPPHRVRQGSRSPLVCPETVDSVYLVKLRVAVMIKKALNINCWLRNAYLESWISENLEDILKTYANLWKFCYELISHMDYNIFVTICKCPKEASSFVLFLFLFYL